MGYATPTFYGDLFLILPAFLVALGFSVTKVYSAFMSITFALTFVSMYYSNIERSVLGISIVYIATPWVLFSFLKMLECDYGSKIRSREYITILRLF